MPNFQKHRGKHPEDLKNFSENQLPLLKNAAIDLSYLLGRGYPDAAALTLVGDRYKINQRQRQALLRVACSDYDVENRKINLCTPEDLKNEVVLIDGYNLLIIIESALSGGMIFKCRDHCYRDIASVHGTYKRVEETLPATELIGKVLAGFQAKKVIWYLDSPISNSGRLKTFLGQLADQNGWDWEINLVYNPDKELIQAEGIIITSDSWVIDKSKKWLNFSTWLIDGHLKDSVIIDILS